MQKHSGSHPAWIELSLKGSGPGIVKIIPLLIVLDLEQLRAVLFDEGQCVGFPCLEEMIGID